MRCTAHLPQGLTPSSGRNEEFLTCATDYAQAVVLCAEILRVFPEWMKGY